MSKNLILIILLAMCLVMGTIPFALGATATTTTKVSISSLYVGASGQKPNQEYVKITNSGTAAVSMKGWKITDSGKKHTYTFPSSFTLKSKATVTLRSGTGTNTASTLYWQKNIFIWNNHDSKNKGDTAYLYNAQSKLVSSRSG